MTASRNSRVLAAALAALLCGCLSPAGVPPDTAFHPADHVSVPTPDAADRTASALARAALVGTHADTERALRNMRAIDTVLYSADERPTGMFDISTDLTNSTLDDDREYQRASLALLARDDVDPLLRARLERFTANDTLVLADDRMHDAMLIEVARAFNTLAEPLGKSITSAQMAPYRLGRAIVNYVSEIYTLEPLPLRKRQALALWHEFLERHPDAPEAEELEPRVERANHKLQLTWRNRALQVAERALEMGRVRLALVYADRALRTVPEDRRASELRDEAARRLVAVREQQRRSLENPADDPTRHAPLEARDMAVALLLPDGAIREGAARLLQVDPHGPLADEARFIMAIALGEDGDEAGMWAALEELADDENADSNMRRHALAITTNPYLNTWRAFEEARSHDRWQRFKWVWLGPFFQGLPDRGMPGPLEWLVDAPALVEHVGGTPMRLINLPWAEALPSARIVATAARNHLAHEPEGTRADVARDWLEDYEHGRQNWAAVLQLREDRPDADLAEIAEFRELAAEQYLQAALRESNIALRLGMYKEIGRIYPDSDASRAAGAVARAEVDEATAQHIRLSRGFLLENPDVAGPLGLGLSPELLDGDSTNAELHPEGVTLVGSRFVRVSYLAPHGDDEQEARRVMEVLEQEHLARVVSLLEEHTFHNMLLDPLEEVGVDARRDVFFERARLGMAEDSDTRPGSISNYTYKGVRERYGIVRHRESILPFELVFQGSLSSLSLGAFPRLHTPRETPDAFLYR
ncbi:MAG: hypothetical protein JRG84_01675 [Deltaproteobacteria bacterium]|nr:hypothetical protein [Deltaproteobacteria bacterium]